MKMKNKVVLVKAYIVFCMCWMIAFLYVIGRVELGLNPEWEKPALIMFGVSLCLVVLMVYFVSKVDLYPKKLNTKPVIKQFGIENFESFEEQIFQAGEKKQFQDVKQIISKNNVKTQMAFRNEDRKVTVLQTVWLDEFDRDLLQEATDTFWKEAEKRIGKGRIQNYVVQLIQCVGVQKMNEQAEEFVHLNLPQNFDQYQSINVISFDEKLIYICQTEDKFLEKPFRKLEGLFLEIMEDVFV